MAIPGTGNRRYRRAQPQPRPPPTPVTSAPTVPSTPVQFTIQTTPASFSTAPSAISTPAAQSSSAHFPIPTTPISSTPAASTQPKLRRPKQNQWQKVDSIVHLITKEFRSLGAFLEVLFHVRDVSASDPRTASHKQQVTAFLDGESNIGMAHIIDLIYRHPQGRPPSSGTESDLYFAPPDVAKPRDIKFAHPALSTWALQLVGPELRRQIGNLTQNDPDDPEDITRLRASTNGLAKLIRSATWDDLGRVSIPWMAATYKRRTRAGCRTFYWLCFGTKVARLNRNGTDWAQGRTDVGDLFWIGFWFWDWKTSGEGESWFCFVLFCFGAPEERFRRTECWIAQDHIRWSEPRTHTKQGSVADIWSFNPTFACKAHVDEKRIMSRFGFTVHDSTARACLDSLTDSSLAKLRESVAEGIKNGTMRWQIVLDNVQQYCRQRDHRIGRQDVLKIGTAATAILLEDCAPGAFDLQDHLERVMRQERRELTTEFLFEDIDWPYIQDLMALHWVRILVNFIPQLAHLRKEMGLDETALDNLIFMARGDGASVAAMWRIKKFLAAHPSHYKAFRNLVPPGPEAWHTRWTQLSAMAANHYGPVSSSDPSSLSKSATAAGAKRPTNLKKVDFFPTSRSMQLFYDARVLDCFRVSFEADDIIAHFEDPRTPVPDVESLRESARVLVRRYASQEAYNQALSEELMDSANGEMKIPRGTPWTQPVDNSQSERADDAHGDAEPDEDTEAVVVDDLAENAGLEEFFEDAESDSRTKKGKKQKKGKHMEAPGFSGDRGMANGILFLQDMGWWVIAAHAVPDGEVGRLWEILKVWIINFSGSSNHNYTNYLLEMYCLHRYEASKDFSDAMFNNSLVNPTGLQWVECDFAQEGYNKWLEEMVEHKGGDFDDHFYRHTLAPNVMHFLRIKEKMQTAFELKPRGNTHTATHLRNEFQQLLRMHKEDELHLFRLGRTNGYAAVNFFHRGYERLEESRMANFIEQSTAYADTLYRQK
ncbi:hypothetical protein B0H17DRAFT_1232529 [Mycena rosella]|uniref:DUF6589 domain-containing protein n=1 Tax=Mycena rosella TaxID=1033263 RepID=A0AAD7D5N0_MYCRO|nr:hypothetical protein B0H17DRAFT_1232529 [Mycena rosella]